CQLQPTIDRLWDAVRIQPDPAAEERLYVRRRVEVEEGAPFQEEVALLRKEERKSGEVHLPLIDLGLREVRVDREVGAEVRREVVIQIDADVGGSLPLDRRIATGSLRELSDDIRSNVQPESLAHVVDPDQETRVRHT